MHQLGKQEAKDRSSKNNERLKYGCFFIQKFILSYSAAFRHMNNLNKCSCAHKLAQSLQFPRKSMSKIRCYIRIWKNFLFKIVSVVKNGLFVFTEKYIPFPSFPCLASLAFKPVPLCSEKPENPCMVV